MKNTFKRISAWVLVLCLILVQLPMRADAATYTDPTVSATAVTGAAGETVDVEIVMHNNPGIVSMVMRVGYDSSVLTLKGVTDAGILGTQVHSDDYTRNPYQLTWANDLATTNFTANGTLVTLHFEIAADAPAGTYPIEVSYTKDNFEIFDCDANELDVDTAPGSVTVTASGSGDDTPGSGYTNPTVSATAVTGAAGETVEVSLVMHNNPGIVSMVMRVGYDSGVLTLTKVTDGGILGTSVHSDNYTRNPYQLTWANDLATTNFTADGTLVTLTFQIAADAEAGTYPIEVSYTKNNFEIFDCDANELDVDTAPGSVTVTAAAACTHAGKTAVPAKASTCVTQGNNLYYTCPDCGVVLKSDGITETTVAAETLPLGGHTGGTATCENQAVCSVCSQPYGELAAHTFREVPAKSSDCVTAGNNLYYVCSVCDQAFKADKVTKTTADAETLPLAGHTGGTATCEGKAVCIVCSQPYGELGEHDLEEVPAKSPSCTASGNNRYYTCADCDTVFKADGVTETTVEAETIPASGHAYTYKATKAPTTTATGTLTGTCSGCSGTTTVTLPKLNTTDYSYSVITEPTTTAEGTGRYTWKTTTYGTFSFDVSIDKLPAETASGQIVIEGVTAKPGETIAVPVYISENPGFAYAKFKLDYSDELTLVSVENQELFVGTFTASKTLDVKPYVLQWSGADDSTGNGCFVILNFKVADDAVDGTYEITLTCDEAYNSALEDVTFRFTNNPLTVISYIYGDVNGDWVINGKDIILLNQYLAEWGVTIIEEAADVNVDGKINGKDIILLNQYLAEWGVTLG